ncbi:MAG: DUF1364 family protein [Loktanella sp.]|nr:DUF1364 family protein [Loktanella sp.]
MNLTGQSIYTKGSKPVVSKAMRNAARGKDCTLRLDGCRNDTSTVVLCHLRMFGAAGMGQKPHDALAVFGCASCHAKLDRADTSGTWGYEDVLRALILTLSQQIASGNITVKGD